METPTRKRANTRGEQATAGGSGGSGSGGSGGGWWGWKPPSLLPALTTLVQSIAGTEPEPQPYISEEAKEAVGITPQLLEFVENVSEHPTTFLNYPLFDSENENGDKDSHYDDEEKEEAESNARRRRGSRERFELTEKQTRHAILVLRLVPKLRYLRMRLVPYQMDESMFWKVYFRLIHKKTQEIDWSDTPSTTTSSSDEETERNSRVRFKRQLILSPEDSNEEDTDISSMEGVSLLEISALQQEWEKPKSNFIQRNLSRLEKAMPTWKFNKDTMAEWEDYVMTGKEPSRLLATQFLELIHKGIADSHRHWMWAGLCGCLTFKEKYPNFYLIALQRVFAPETSSNIKGSSSSTFRSFSVPACYPRVPLFGGLFVGYQHLLSPEDLAAAKRILVVLAIENACCNYVPVLPDLVCMLLHYLTEPQVYTCVHLMLNRISIPPPQIPSFGEGRSPSFSASSSTARSRSMSSSKENGRRMSEETDRERGRERETRRSLSMATEQQEGRQGLRRSRDSISSSQSKSTSRERPRSASSERSRADSFSSFFGGGMRQREVRRSPSSLSSSPASSFEDARDDDEDKQVAHSLAMAYFPKTLAEHVLFTMSFMSCFEHNLPELNQRVKALGAEELVKEEVTLWFDRLFVPILTFQLTLRVFDNYLSQGPPFLYRMALACLQHCQEQLLACESALQLITCLRREIRSCVEAKDKDNMSALLQRAHFFGREVNFRTVGEWHAENARLHKDSLEHVEDPFLTLSYTPKPDAPSTIIDSKQFGVVWQWIPSRYRISDVKRVYSNAEHGCSLITLYQRCSKAAPNLLLIKTQNNDIFGAYCSDGWKKSKQFYGSGECFVFTLHPQVRKFSWQQRPNASNNDLFMMGEDSGLSVGGGGEGPALFLDSELWHGHTFASGTFFNDPLTGATGNKDFTCLAVEIYTLVD